MNKLIKLDTLVGMTMVSVEESPKKEDDVLIFKADNGRIFQLYHQQDCCESVDIEDITGDLKDLVGSPILQAEEVTNEPEPDPPSDLCSCDTFTWTFYKFATAKGYVTVRWFGTSNGYYSESVDLYEIV